MPSEQAIAVFKKRLEEEREKLLAEIKKNNPHEDFGSDIDGFDEEADEAEAFATHLSVNRTREERINEIDSALNRIQLGTYGVCEKCGGPLSDALLEAVPESLLCESCKKKE